MPERTTITKRLTPALLLALLWLPLPAMAVLLLDATGELPINIEPHLRYLEDPQHELSLQQLLEPERKVAWRALAHGEQANFGYTRSAYWLTLRLRRPATSSGQWLLELPFSSLDRAELFVVEPHSGRLRQHAVSGDLVPFAERPYPHANLVFPLQLAPGQTRDIYLRVSSGGSLSAGGRLWPEAGFHHHSRDVYSGLSLYFGLMGALLLYNLLLLASLRDRTYLYYVALMLAMAIAQAGWTGIGYEYLWPKLPAWANLAPLAGFNAAGLFSALFTRRFLMLGHNAPHLDRLMLGFTALFTLSLLLSFVMPYRAIAISTSVAGMVFSLTAIASAILCLHRGNVSARYFLVAWGVLLVGVAAMAARNLGWLPTNALTSYCMLIGSALEMVLLSVALADRIQLLQRDKEQAEHAAMAAHRSMLQVMEQTGLELEHKVRERTRHLEALNHDLQTRERQLETLAHHDPLTGLHNRLSFENKLNESLLRSQLRDQQLALLMLDLDGFKPVNDRYGHDVGDALLQVIARRLQQHVRSSDTVARIGGDEFTILLENIHATHELQKIANGILQSFNAPITLDTLQLHVGVSIGVALFPEDGTTPAAITRSADKAMYQAKLEGRGRYVMTSAAANLN